MSDFHRNATPSELLATTLADNDAAMLENLIWLRECRITQMELAKRLSVSLQTIIDFEKYDSDPSLSQIRRYAHAIGATVRHTVTSA